MTIKNWMKPSYIKAEFLQATKQGWCYTKNNNEVIVAVPHLPNRLESQGLDPETGEQLEAPINNVLPIVTGIAKAGNTLTTTDGIWTGSPIITYTYAWESSPDGTAWTTVDGETNNTLALTEANVGLRYRSKISAKNSQGTVVANSAASDVVVTSLVAPSNTVVPVLSGTPEVGQTLSVTNGTWAGSPTINYTYNWKSSTDGLVFTSTGTTTSNYTLVEGDVDKTFQVEVTGTNTAGNATATSNNIGPVTNVELEP